MPTNKVRGSLALFSLAFALAAQPCASQEGRPPLSIEPVPKAALRVDTRPISLGLSAGGFGLALGGELPLGLTVTLVAEAQYMDLSDGETSFLTLHCGARAYPARRGIEGLFAGAYALGLAGSRYGESSQAFGFMLEAGYAWLPRLVPGLVVEPYIKYPYFFGDEVLVGIAPGLSIGWVF